MTTLKSICQANNLFLWDEIPAKYKEHGQQRKDYFDKYHPDPIPAYFLADTSIETGIFWKCSTQDAGTTREYNYIQDHPEILLMKDGIVARLCGNDYRNKGKYWLSIPYFIYTKFHDLDRYHRERATADIAEPNKIGVFTAKKVQDWFLYVDTYTKALEALKDTNKDANAAIAKEIEGFAATVPGAKASRWENGSKTDSINFDCKYFRVFLVHHKDSAYLEKRIEFKGKIEDVSRIENL